MATERPKPAKTAQERQAEARREKLAHVDEQVASGNLVIRQMTRAEQEAWAKRRRTVARSPQSKRASQAAEVDKPA